MSVEIARDTFQRADNTSLGTPEFTSAEVTYSKVQEGPALAHINNNQLTLSSSAAGSSNRAYVFAQTNHPNHGIFVRVASSGNTDGNPISLFVSCSTPTSGGLVSTNYGPQPSSGFSMVFGRDAGFIPIALHRVTGTNTSASVANFQPTTGLGARAWNAGDELGLVIVYDRIMAFVNGRCVWSAQDATLLSSAGTYCGVASHFGGDNTNPIRISHLRIVRSTSNVINHTMPVLAYDRDGSTLWRGANFGSFVQLSSTEAKTLQDVNDEDNVVNITQGNGQNHNVAVMFPEPRQFWGAVIAHQNLGGTNGGLYYTTSPVGTNPGSASWNQLNGSVGAGGYFTISGISRAGWPVNPDYRYRVQIAPGLLNAASGSNVTGICYEIITNPTPLAMKAFVLYGVIPPLASHHRIAFWHPYLDIRLPGDLMDMDDLVRGQIAYREFRIKNMSLSLTMNNVVLDLESHEYGTTMTNQYSIKRASEGTYQPNTTITSLAPGAISEIISVRRIVAADAPYKVDSLRVRSQIGSMS